MGAHRARAAALSLIITRGYLPRIRAVGSRPAALANAAKHKPRAFAGHALESEAGQGLDRVDASDDGALRWAQENPDRYHRLSEIDTYGTTIRNKVQLEQTIPEMRVLLAETENDNEACRLVEVLRLMERATSRVHTYVRFSGD